MGIKTNKGEMEHYDTQKRLSNKTYYNSVEEAVYIMRKKKKQKKPKTLPGIYLTDFMSTIYKELKK